MSETAKQIVELPRQEPQSILPMTLVQRAFEQGNLELVERAMALQERWEKTQAKSTFEAAMAAAQNDLPVILKTKSVNLGSGRGYKYEDFATIDRTVKPVLKQHGISYRFTTEHLTDGRIKVTCILYGHGHSEPNSLAAKPDTSGAKNEVQSIGSAQTYLQRYTLKAALGLAASEDDDGRGGTQQQTQADDTGEVLSAEQIGTLEAALAVREMPKERLIKWIKAAYRNQRASEINDLADIPVAIYQLCLNKIQGDQQ